MTEDELKQLGNLPYYDERMERIEMMKGFSKDNNGLSCMEPANFARYIDWLENRLFEAHNEIKRLRLYGVSGAVCEHQNTSIKPTWQVGSSMMTCDDCGKEL